jgi:uncharacterized transporter YbjL
VEEQTVKSQNQSSNEARNQQRREFIKTSTLLGAGVAVGAMTSTAAIADVGTTGDEKPEQKGYQLSQHVLDYYKSADV